MTPSERRPSAIDRLTFCLPDFTRRVWVSDQARACWEPRILRIVEMLRELELRTIVNGNRRCALRSILASQLSDVRDELTRTGLAVECLQGTASGSGYASAIRPSQESAPSNYWCAIAKQDDLPEVARAYRNEDDTTLGEMLGYPKCCIRFFQRTWRIANWIDTTWPMAVESPSAVLRDPHTFEFSSPSPCTVQLRWLGVRSIFHLPCSFTCEDSIRAAKLHLQLARDLGFADECDWLEEMLRWPTEWTALHGIAEIRCPVVKIVARTDATPVKLVVRCNVDGSPSPDHGGQGLEFPFRRHVELPLVTSRSFQAGLNNPIVNEEESFPHGNAPWYSQDNGFPTRYAMDQAQMPIVDRTKHLLSQHAVPTIANHVVDLGCRNGALLRKLCLLDPALIPQGIDKDPARVDRAYLLNPGAPKSAFVVGDFLDSRHQHSAEKSPAYLTILMLGRLADVPASVARTTLIRLCKSTRHFFVYAHDDWLRQIGSLSTLANQLDIVLLDTTRTPYTEIAEVAVEATIEALTDSELPTFV